MTSIQSQKLKMYLTLQVLLKANPDALAKMPNGNELLTTLSSLITLIQNNVIQQQKGTGDLTKQKNSLRSALIDDSLDTSHKMQAYAGYAKDTDLFEKVKLNETDVKKLTDEDLVVEATSLYNLVAANLNKVTSYGLTAETQAAFLSAITTFEAALPQMRKERQDQKNVTVHMADEFDSADDTIDQLDLQAELVKEAYAQFYSDYKQLRKVSVNFKTVPLMAKVTDAASGEPVANVTLSFTLNGNSMPDIIKQTAAKGGCMVKNIEQGHYTVEVSKFGYETQILTIAVSADEPYDLKVKLVKS